MAEPVFAYYICIFAMRSSSSSLQLSCTGTRSGRRENSPALFHPSKVRSSVGSLAAVLLWWWHHLNLDRETTACTASHP